MKMTRRIKVIDGRLQYLMIAISLTIIVAGLLLFAAATTLYFMFARAGTGAPASELLLTILPPLLLNDLAIMILFIVAGIFLTHRIAGPIYRIEMDIDRVLAGNRGARVHLRKRDAFNDLADKVNTLLERIDEG
ncbi:MAG: hypothetical protein ABSF77_10550 [Spirochaetia bacterium]